MKGPGHLSIYSRIFPKHLLHSGSKNSSESVIMKRPA